MWACRCPVNASNATVTDAFEHSPWPAMNIDLGTSLTHRLALASGALSCARLAANAVTLLVSCPACNILQAYKYLNAGNKSAMTAGEGAAALAYNLLLVYAFLAPMRA